MSSSSPPADASTWTRFNLDIRALETDEIAKAKAVLREMNIDRRFRAKGIERPAGTSVPRTAVAQIEFGKYNPESAPDAQSWLALGEHKRISLVEEHHRAARIKLPNLKVHAVFHEIVENQLASKLEPVVRAMERLTKDGLTRHDAVHAVGVGCRRALLRGHDGAAERRCRYRPSAL